MIQSFRSRPIPPGRNPPPFPSASCLACSRVAPASFWMRPTSENVDYLTRISLICARLPILPVSRGSLSHMRRKSIPPPARRVWRHWRSIRSSHLFILSCRSSATITTFRDRAIHAQPGPVVVAVSMSPRWMTISVKRLSSHGTASVVQHRAVLREMRPARHHHHHHVTNVGIDVDVATLQRGHHAPRPESKQSFPSNETFGSQFGWSSVWCCCGTDMGAEFVGQAADGDGTGAGAGVFLVVPAGAPLLLFCFLLSGSLYFLSSSSPLNMSPWGVTLHVYFQSK